MRPRAKTLGTQVRRLLDMLDPALEHVYRKSGISYRPRYTPVVRALLDVGPASITEIAQIAGITHSAVSQTVTEMRRNGLVAVAKGADARERTVALTAAAVRLLPRLQRQWAATNAAAAELEGEIDAPLVAILEKAIQALTKAPFDGRVKRHMDARKARKGKSR